MSNPSHYLSITITPAPGVELTPGEFDFGLSLADWDYRGQDGFETFTSDGAEPVVSFSGQTWRSDYERLVQWAKDASQHPDVADVTIFWEDSEDEPDRGADVYRDGVRDVVDSRITAMVPANIADLLKDAETARKLADEMDADWLAGEVLSERGEVTITTVAAALRRLVDGLKAAGL